MIKPWSITKGRPAVVSGRRRQLTRGGMAHVVERQIGKKWLLMVGNSLQPYVHKGLRASLRVILARRENTISHSHSRAAGVIEGLMKN